MKWQFIMWYFYFIRTNNLSNPIFEPYISQQTAISSLLTTLIVGDWGLPKYPKKSTTCICAFRDISTEVRWKITPCIVKEEQCLLTNPNPKGDTIPCQLKVVHRIWQGSTLVLILMDESDQPPTKLSFWKHFDFALSYDTKPCVRARAINMHERDLI